MTDIVDRSGAQKFAHFGPSKKLGSKIVSVKYFRIRNGTRNLTQLGKKYLKNLIYIPSNANVCKTLRICNVIIVNHSEVVELWNL